MVGIFLISMAVALSRQAPRPMMCGGAASPSRSGSHSVGPADALERKFEGEEGMVHCDGKR